MFKIGTPVRIKKKPGTANILFVLRGEYDYPFRECKISYIGKNILRDMGDICYVRERSFVSGNSIERIKYPIEIENLEIDVIGELKRLKGKK